MRWGAMIDYSIGETAVINWCTGMLYGEEILLLNGPWWRSFCFRGDGRATVQYLQNEPHTLVSEAPEANRSQYMKSVSYDICYPCCILEVFPILYVAGNAVIIPLICKTSARLQHYK
ncbi:hypothetical protein BT96DRAFT_942402 [Gymnopus androsaceus JB14]|uniref:Uncharacterized protein n=1 Tax=Gymnopus androsaceus JB14 TaxID=1447944 RepID=A0A6A4HE26_9AGAR|nr:hypothetical protein BT96DRAFT_942402 [Gymnopus androsaceus JB14]